MVGRQDSYGIFTESVEDSTFASRDSEVQREGRDVIANPEVTMPSGERPRILIYKRTHEGDPDPGTGVFGNNDCMKRVRGFQYDAVIGVGGVGCEPRVKGIAGKVTWIGVGPHRRRSTRREGPLVTFDYFRYFGQAGPLLEVLAPKLAGRIFGRNVRVVMSTGLSDEERREAEQILTRARRAPASGKALPPVDRRGSSCRSKCHPAGKC